MSILANQRPKPAATGGGATPRHVAIIMDGNGRWAAARGLPRGEGHRRGVEAVRRTVRMALELAIGNLTLFSFSSENWSRPRAEVDFLFSLFRLYVRRDVARLHAEGVRITVIGRRDGLPGDILALIEESEALTRENRAMRLIFAFNYGGRDEIARGVAEIARKVAAGALDPASVDASTIGEHLDTVGLPDPDLVIRTGGELRLSNFLLWQSAYAELVFLPTYWPDFGKEALQGALDEFASRARRYGGVEEQGAP